MSTDRWKSSRTSSRSPVKLAAIAAVAVLIVGACGTAASPEPSPSAESESSVATPSAGAATLPPDVVRPFDLAIAAGLDTAPLFAAIDNDFYTEEGLGVTPRIQFSGVELVNALVAGDAQVAVIGTAIHFTSVEKGIPLRIIALEHGLADSTTYGTASLVAGPNAGVGVGEFANLRGKKIGVPLATDGEFGFLAFLREGGLTAQDVELVKMAPPDMTAALQQRKRRRASASSSRGRRGSS